MTRRCHACRRIVTGTVDDRLVLECHSGKPVLWCHDCDERLLAASVRDRAESWIRMGELLGKW
jgi:hypothetical protein